MSRNKYPEETIKLILDISEKLFMKNGYDNTSIQDIINGLGGLSKGAVYHHFKSKEEIFDAVSRRHGEKIGLKFHKLLKDKSLNGYEKLKEMFRISLADADDDILYSSAPEIMTNPRLLAAQVKGIFYDVVPFFIRPVIDEGIKDGSIKTDYPQELSEVIVTLTNLWLNPMIIHADIETMSNRVRFFDQLLESQGIKLLDDNMLNDYIYYCQTYHNKINCF